MKPGKMIGRWHACLSGMIVFLLCGIVAQAATIIDHTSTKIEAIPESAIIQAKTILHIAYGHTSHGSQLISGMENLVTFMNNKGYPNNLYAFNNGGNGGALDLHNYAMDGDVGYYPDWVNNTRSYLGVPNPATGRGTGANADVNVIIWSWCGQVSWQSEQSMITNYLAPMSALEADYPGITFVYMTGHLDGSGAEGNLNIRNNQIRAYCLQNNKVLFDFADIESYDPDGLTNYMPLLADDGCNYDSDGNGSRDRNWANDWQGTHTLGVDWFQCDAAHTTALNGNLKAYAAWWLWARIAGWNGNPEVTLTVSISGNGSVNSQNQIGTNYACNSVTCPPMTFGYNDTVTLTPTGSNATFSAWSGDYKGNSNPGIITMNGDKVVTATFTAEPAYVKIDGDTTQYYALGSALNAVTQDATIRARDFTFGEYIVMTTPVKILLKGGYSDTGFSSQSGYSTISGYLKIRTGELKVEQLKIKSP